VRTLDRQRLFVLATVGVAIVCFVVASESGALGLMAIPLWALAAVTTARGEGVALPRAVVLALVAAATAYAFSQGLQGSEKVIRAVSEYLVWLTLVKLFDHAAPRDHAQLLTMSLFIVLGATLTSAALSLGLWLAIFIVLFVWTTMQHQLEKGRHEVETSLERLRPHTRRVAGPVVGAGQRPTRAFAGVMIAALVATGCVATILFVTLPRSPIPMGRGFGNASAQRTSGFSEQVRLGGEGIISRSATPVLDLRLLDADGANVGGADRSVRLRGSVLDSYRDGEWRRTATLEEHTESQTQPPSEPMRFGRPDPEAERLIQEISFINRPSRTIFTVHRPVRMSFERRVDKVSYNRADWVVSIEATGRLGYRVESDVDGRYSPQSERWSSPEDNPFRTGRVRALADRILRESGLSRDPDAEHTEQDEAIALAFERHLQQNYAYTDQLPGQIGRADPIEQFLFERDEGHCEYFAASLAALCRAVGLPARVVTGYLATEFDEQEQTYRVRESDAHAWTEVNVAPGHWKTFDASPPAGLRFVHERPDGLLWRLRMLWDELERVWVDNVVAYDESRQEEIIGESPSSLAASVQDWMLDLGRMPGAELRARAINGVATAAIVFTGVTGLGVLLTRAGGVLLVFLRSRAAQRGRSEDPDAQRRREQASFFRDFERLARRAGLARAPSEAPGLHARRLADLDRPLGSAAISLIDLYYRSRWEGRLLDEREVAEARSLLQRVADRLDARAGKPSATLDGRDSSTTLRPAHASR